jgi:hypothetical protein
MAAIGELDEDDSDMGMRGGGYGGDGGEINK